MIIILLSEKRREYQLIYMCHTFPDPDFPAQTFMESKSSLNPLAFKKDTTKILNYNIILCCI